MKLVASLVVLLLGALMTTTHAVDSAKVSAEFAALYAQWDEAIVKADLVTLNKLYADEARLTSPDGKLETKADSMGQIESGQYKASNPSTTDLQVRLYGDTAVVTCVWKAAEIIQGKKVDGHYRFTDVWVKRDGRWQVVASHGTPVE